MTCATIAAAPKPARVKKVVARECVTTLTVRLLNLLRNATRSAEDIVPQRKNLEMIGVGATGILAPMMNSKRAWN
jgi:hypothetical protein